MKAENIIFNYYSREIEYFVPAEERFMAVNGVRVLISYTCKVSGNDVTVIRGESRMNGKSPIYEAQTFYGEVIEAKKRGFEYLLRRLGYYEFHFDTYSKRDEYQEIVSLVSSINPKKMKQVQTTARKRRNELEKPIVSLINYKRGLYGKNKAI